MNNSAGKRSDSVNTSNVETSKGPREEKVSRYLKDGIVIYHSDTLHVSQLFESTHNHNIAPKRKDQRLFIQNGRRSQVFLYWTLLQEVLHSTRVNEDTAHPRQYCVEKGEEDPTESVALH